MIIGRLGHIDDVTLISRLTLVQHAGAVLQTCAALYVLPHLWG